MAVFLLLGGVAVVVDGVASDLGPARQRCVLAALAVDAGRVVSVERLTHRVWGECPPLRARATLMGYLSRLRRILADVDVGAVVRHPGGYVLDVERSTVDLHRFHELCARARTRAADDVERVVLLEQALEVWRGDALTGIEGDWALAKRHELHQQRLDAECDLTEARLRLGHGEDLVAPLSARAAECPLDERVAAQFILALHRAGRTADALAHYRHLRDLLVEQLGTDPGTTLQELHQRILDTDAALTPPPATGDGTTVVRNSTMPVPRQLPALPRLFTGRAAELARLDEMLFAAPGTPVGGAVAISTIGGVGGIGKTWLALAWAHRHVDAFPDGQLFVDLHGFSATEQPVPPDAALSGFLAALGVVPDHLPTGPDAKAALYRSLVADRRMLVVLDNAATADQVIPMLPGSPTCTVLVTGRTRPAQLIDRHSAHHLQLDVLTDAEARALLARRLGDTRVVAEPGAVAELVALCGHHPLALAITARHARTRPDIPVAEIAAELREAGLDALDDGDPAVSLPAVLSWSLRTLAPEQRTAFALLGIAPGPDTGVPAAAALTGLPERRTHAVLRALTDASLINRVPGGRYAMHVLVRAYATDTAHSQLPDDVREAALLRVLNFFADTAHAADRLLRPGRDPAPFEPDVPTQPLCDATAALAWFDTEYRCLLAAHHTATTLGWHPLVWRLARATDTFRHRRAHLHDRLMVWQAATAHGSGPTTRVIAWRHLGSAHSHLGHHDDALDHLHRALDLAEHHHDLAEQAHTHHTLAEAFAHRGDDRKALDHAHRALDLYRTLDRPPKQAVALTTVGFLTARLGDHDTARAHCRTALTLHRRHGNPDGEAAALDSLGYVEYRSGHHAEAVDHYHRALALLRDLGDVYETADSLDGLGHPYVSLGQTVRAHAVWREAVQLYRKQGRHDDADRVLHQLDTINSAGGAAATGPRSPVPAAARQRS